MHVTMSTALILDDDYDGKITIVVVVLRERGEGAGSEMEGWNRMQLLFWWQNVKRKKKELYRGCSATERDVKLREGMAWRDTHGNEFVIACSFPSALVVCVTVCVCTHPTQFRPDLFAWWMSPRAFYLTYFVSYQFYSITVCVFIPLHCIALHYMISYFNVISLSLFAYSTRVIKSACGPDIGRVVKIRKPVASGFPPRRERERDETIHQHHHHRGTLSSSNSSNSSSIYNSSSSSSHHSHVQLNNNGRTSSPSLGTTRTSSNAISPLPRSAASPSYINGGAAVPPPSSSLSSSTSSALQSEINPELMRRPLRERITHLLAIRPYKKPELIARLHKGPFLWYE